MSYLFAESDLFSKVGQHNVIPLVAIGGSFLIGIVLGVTGIIVGYLRRSRQTEIEASLKQDMLNRGMSADEIAKVINSGGEYR